MSGEDFLALTGLVTGSILQLTLVDIDGVVESASRSGVAWLDLEVASLLLVYEEEGRTEGQVSKRSSAGQDGMMGK